MRAKQILKKLLFVVIVFVVLYTIAFFVLPLITVNNNTNNKKEITIYIKTNGVHTDVVVPLKNKQKDWSTLIKFSNVLSKDTTYTYVALGWGDKGFYLETPTWADLTVKTAIKAATGFNTTAMHATFYTTMVENVSCKKIELSKEQYNSLINFIETSFITDNSGNACFINTTAVYGNSDAFYEAVGRYSIFYTCNTWANNALKACGQKSCLWTALDKPIFNKY